MPRATSLQRTQSLPLEPPKTRAEPNVYLHVDAAGHVVAGTDAWNGVGLDMTKEAFVASYMAIANQWMTKEDGKWVTHHAYPTLEEAEAKWALAVQRWGLVTADDEETVGADA